jgi:BASS family bile acid:Na+ symporter
LFIFDILFNSPQDLENLFSDILLPVAIAIIMLGMGLAIEYKDFKNIFRYPKAVIIGLICQMVLLPLIAFSIASIFNFNPLFKVGLIIIAACPGGATSNLVNYLLRGNIALSISITVINSLITLLTIPLIVSMGVEIFLSQQTEIHLPVGSSILQVFLLTVLPVYTGVSLRHRYPAISGRIEKYNKIILPLLLLAIYSGVIFIDEGEESSHILENLNVVPYPFLLNLLSMLLGWGVAKLSRLRPINQFTIPVEVGLQNSALAIFVAATLLGSQTMAIVPVIYGSFSFFTTYFYGYMLKKFSK